MLTSTAAGAGGASFGWINCELIASGKLQPHMNAFGGEDRFWLGPEGGQFSIFFAPGAKFELSDWFTPAPVDTMPYQLVKQSADQTRFAAAFALTNYSGTRFDVQVDREVRLLSAAIAWKELGVKPAPGKSLTHIHRTIHLSGPEQGLDAVARATLGISLAEIQNALKR